MTLDERIVALSDRDAQAALLRFSEAQHTANLPKMIDASLVEQFRQEAGLTTITAVASDEGGVARAALRVLAADPAHREGLEYLLTAPSETRFAVVESVMFASAVLVALQTHVRFERNKDGTWAMKIEKKPTDASLLKELFKKILGHSW
jgi:hypothetical protein